MPAETRRGLNYPFGYKASQEFGTLVEVAEGVYWFRTPLPFRLDHINLWLLEDGDEWVIVDTGLNTADVRDLWEGMFDGVLAGRLVNKVIVTHMHPDHVGLAGWLTRHFSCELWMTQLEFLTCHTLVGDTGKAAPGEAIEFYFRSGFSEADLDHYREMFGSFGAMVSRLPGSYFRLVDGYSMQIGGRRWEVVVGSGHSPEHGCVYCPEANVLISGDQVLPVITSNVSVYPTEPEANPLANWLDSCRSLKGRVTDDVIVLPAHQSPFEGLHERLEQLLSGHDDDLNKLLEFLVRPRTAKDCFTTLFGKEIKRSQTQMAIGETLAHLNYLLNQGDVVRDREGGAPDYYSLSG
jgi:glyoxylase-like metal-dependent hydrolase (beta-lactamase superfamily II)